MNKTTKTINELTNEQPRSHFFLTDPLSLMFFELESCAWSQNTQFCSFLKIHFQTPNILASMIGKLFLVLTWRDKPILCSLANWQKCGFLTPLHYIPHIIFKNQSVFEKENVIELSFSQTIDEGSMRTRLVTILKYFLTVRGDHPVSSKYDNLNFHTGCFPATDF